ncbi:MAG: TonB-dependent receptor [Deltaproteobacteria bacterium]|nr:TonB-dependent receptor [Deltaproteobacteria bacterium]
MPRTIPRLLPAVALRLPALPAHADDLADEADLQFRIGAERYAAGDARGALEHFLASNRLVRNRNVLFNVARTYENLCQYPEAYRYYGAALVDEPDQAARARIEQALTDLGPRVAVLEVETTPRGATLYVDRKDLGSRGEAPRSLGLAAGRYRVLSELPGHYPAETLVESVALGAAVRVHLQLRPILGELRIEGPAAGAAVRIDGEAAGPRCVVPCAVELPPGRHQLSLTRAASRTVELTVDVVARGSLTLRPELPPITGFLVVSTDEPGALVEVDGEPRGFTPGIVRVPAGEHRLRVSHPSFRAVERRIVIPEDGELRVEEVLQRAEEVQAASRIAEGAEDAPSSVTVISREELTAFAFPTLADALRGVRGVSTWNDRTYAAVGFRGLGRLGSYSNRALVLADGHPTNDDWIGSAYVGFEGRTDLADVERIEVVRGLGSVLYGTNAFSGVMNLVTRRPPPGLGGEVGVSAVDARVGRGRVRQEAAPNDETSFWASVSGAQGAGRSSHFDGLGASPGGTTVRGADGFEAGTAQARATYRSLTVQGFRHSHEKRLPTGAFETLPGDPRTRQTDTRGFVELRAEPRLGEVVQLFSRAHFNHYAFAGDYARDPVDGRVEEHRYVGQWVGVEQRVVLDPIDRLRITLGGGGQVHHRVDAEARDDAGVFLDETGADGRDHRVGALYGSVDLQPIEPVRLTAGARLDAYSTFGSALSPRLAVVSRPYARGNLKVLAGRAFRAPSIYELYYNDGRATQQSSPDLEPETSTSVEVEHQHRFSPTITAVAAVYTNVVRDLIVSRGEGTPGDLIRYVNSGSPLVSVGAEVGVRRDLRQGLLLEASTSVQQTRFVASGAASDIVGLRRDPATREVENSPVVLGSVKGIAPLLGRAARAALRLTLEGARWDRNETVGGATQRSAPAAVVCDLVISGREDRLGLSWALGAYNLTDARVEQPVSAEFPVARVAQNGRSLLASVDVAF